MKVPEDSQIGEIILRKIPRDKASSDNIMKIIDDVWQRAVKRRSILYCGDDYLME